MMFRYNNLPIYFLASKPKSLLHVQLIYNLNARIISFLVKIAYSDWYATVEGLKNVNQLNTTFNLLGRHFGKIKLSLFTSKYVLIFHVKYQDMFALNIKME